MESSRQHRKDWQRPLEQNDNDSDDEEDDTQPVVKRIRVSLLLKRKKETSESCLLDGCSAEPCAQLEGSSASHFTNVRQVEGVQSKTGPQRLDEPRGTESICITISSEEDSDQENSAQGSASCFLNKGPGEQLAEHDITESQYFTCSDQSSDENDPHKPPGRRHAAKSPEEHSESEVTSYSFADHVNEESQYHTCSSDDSERDNLEGTKDGSSANLPEGEVNESTGISQQFVEHENTLSQYITCSDDTSEDSVIFYESCKEDPPGESPEGLEQNETTKNHSGDEKREHSDSNCLDDNVTDGEDKIAAAEDDDQMGELSEGKKMPLERVESDEPRSDDVIAVKGGSSYSNIDDGIVQIPKKLRNIELDNQRVDSGIIRSDSTVSSMASITTGDSEDVVLSTDQTLFSHEQLHAVELTSENVKQPVSSNSDRLDKLSDLDSFNSVNKKCGGILPPTLNHGVEPSPIYEKCCEEGRTCDPLQQSRLIKDPKDELHPQEGCRSQVNDCGSIGAEPVPMVASTVQGEPTHNSSRVEKPVHSDASDLDQDVADEQSIKVAADVEDQVSLSAATEKPEYDYDSDETHIDDLEPAYNQDQNSNETHADAAYNARQTIGGDGLKDEHLSEADDSDTTEIENRDVTQRENIICSQESPVSDVIVIEDEIAEIANKLDVGKTTTHVAESHSSSKNGCIKFGKSMILPFRDAESHVKIDNAEIKYSGDESNSSDSTMVDSLELARCRTMLQAHEESQESDEVIILEESAANDSNEPGISQDRASMAMQTWQRAAGAPESIKSSPESGDASQSAGTEFNRDPLDDDQDCCIYLVGDSYEICPHYI